MDYDGDGDTDIVTGSYTGQFYVFRRNADGGFGQRELLKNDEGATLLMPFDTVYSVTAELVDMDADSDLDLIVGNRSGAVQVDREALHVRLAAELPIQADELAHRPLMTRRSTQHLDVGRLCTRVVGLEPELGARVRDGVGRARQPELAQHGAPRAHPVAQAAPGGWGARTTISAIPDWLWISSAAERAVLKEG